jgi:heptosyltransferase-3
LSSAPDANEMALIAAVCAARDNNSPRSAPSPGIPLRMTLDLSGQLSLKELAALTARARLFVGVDSAPMHIAAAMGTPVVAIFGPSGDCEWGPWGEGHRVVASNTHPCRPCGMAGCNDSKVSDCLTTLPVPQVLSACEELLAIPPAPCPGQGVTEVSRTAAPGVDGPALGSPKGTSFGARPNGGGAA